MWNVLNLVLGLVLLIYCLPTVESVECKKTEIIVGRLGEELEFKFQLSDLRDEYNKYIIEWYGKNIIQTDFQIPKVKKESIIRFRKNMDSTIEQIIYTNGNLTYLAGNRTEIFMTNDAFVVKKTNLQKEDAGIYLIYFELIPLEKKTLIIQDKPKIIGRSPPNPVLKPEDNYTSTIQLECHSVSTSIGDCQLSMNTMWYKSGMKMNDLDPTLSQINVNVDQNGGNFTCLTSDYLPCYERLQTTKYYNDVLNIEECNNVFESKTFIVQPEYPPIDVKLEPDQREIIVTKGEDLKVKCSAKCYPMCDVILKKGDQDLGSTSLVNLPEKMFGKKLKLENIHSSHEGHYGCLVNNTYGESNKKFTLSVTEESDLDIFFLCFLLLVPVIVILAVIEYRWPVVSKKRRESRRAEKEKKMEENIEESQLKKMKEWKREILEFIEEREPIKMEEDKKEMEERKKKMSESIEERELIRMEVVSKKRRESRRAEKEKKEMLKKSGV